MIEILQEDWDAWGRGLAEATIKNMSDGEKREFDIAIKEGAKRLAEAVERDILEKFKR